MHGPTRSTHELTIGSASHQGRRLYTQRFWETNWLSPLASCKGVNPGWTGRQIYDSEMDVSDNLEVLNVQHFLLSRQPWWRLKWNVSSSLLQVDNAPTSLLDYVQKRTCRRDVATFSTPRSQKPSPSTFRNGFSPLASWIREIQTSIETTPSLVKLYILCVESFPHFYNGRKIVES